MAATVDLNSSKFSGGSSTTSLAPGSGVPVRVGVSVGVGSSVGVGVSVFFSVGVDRPVGTSVRVGVDPSPSPPHPAIPDTPSAPKSFSIRRLSGRYVASASVFLRVMVGIRVQPVMHHQRRVRIGLGYSSLL